MALTRRLSSWGERLHALRAPMSLFRSACGRAAAAPAALPPQTEEEAAELAEAVGPDATVEERSEAVKRVRGRCAARCVVEGGSQGRGLR